VSGAEATAAAFGDARPIGHGWRCRCPLGDRSALTFRDGAKRLLSKCFGRCASKDVCAELRNGLYDGRANGTAQPEPEIRAEYDAKAAADTAKRKSRIANALDIWRNSYPADNTTAETYHWSRLLARCAKKFWWSCYLRQPAPTPNLAEKARSIRGEAAS
jgi:hypothetical protein